MTLLDDFMPPLPQDLRDGPEPRVTTGMGPYESSYDVAHGYAVERPILVPRG